MLAARTDGFALAMAGPEDREALLALARAFHAEDAHPLSQAGEAALVRLAGDDTLGFAALLTRKELPVGYAVICFGYSIEWGGRDAFLDDFYVAPAERGAGVGGWMVEVLAEEARRRDVKALHLELMPGNPAERLYARRGFGERGSRLMTRILG